jgi:DNA-binding transcriptional ArsR family regulator
MGQDMPKVRDFSSQERSIPVVVEASPVYELLLGLFVYGNKEGAKEYECGSTFFEQIEEGVSASVADRLAEFSDCGEMWLPLIAIAHESGSLGSAADLVNVLTLMDGMTLRRRIVFGHYHKDGVSDDDLEAAAAGDEATITRLVDQELFCAGLGKMLKSDSGESQTRIVETIVAVNAVLEPSIMELLPALRRDADEKRTLARSMEPTALVETATNGVTFRMQPRLSDILLVPSKIIRPWTVIMEHKGLTVFAYSVADEHLTADPDAPPSYLVDLYKALGDEKRLRILAILNEGDAALMEIAEQVDLAKSTAHHHLRILRSAGLVRVTVGETKSYSLRRDQIPETSRLLDAYLTTPDTAAQDLPVAEHQRS